MVSTKMAVTECNWMLGERNQIGSGAGGGHDTIADYSKREGTSYVKKRIREADCGSKLSKYQRQSEKMAWM